MSEWWAGLAVIQQVFYYIAAPFTLVLLIQAVLSVIGLGGHDADADADTGADTDIGADSDADGGFDSDMHADFHAEGHMDADTGHEHGAAVAGFRFFTIRGIVAFFCIFGWSGLAFYASGLPIWAVSLLSVISGLIAMLLIGLIFFSVKRLQSSGNIQYANAVGKKAEVYIPIPPPAKAKAR